jgi:hypothetical protein
MSLAYNHPYAILCRLESVRTRPMRECLARGCLRKAKHQAIAYCLPYSPIHQPSLPWPRASQPASRVRLALFAPGGDEARGAYRRSCCCGFLETRSRETWRRHWMCGGSVVGCKHLPCMRHDALLPCATRATTDKRLAIDSPTRIQNAPGTATPAAASWSLPVTGRRPPPAHLDHMNYSHRYTCIVARLDNILGFSSSRPVTWPMHEAVALSNPDGPHALRQRG